ncbi:transposase [Nocardia terpenica]|uniref:transposase n=1 Tax=Nocardia terpenica TaxID=455432 RepID=UPI002B4B2A8D|nr:transposase [Nocardia terpenica]
MRCAVINDLVEDLEIIDRKSNRDRFASWNDTAPVDASSGDRRRHRLSRSGNRKINPVLHIMAVVQLRADLECLQAHPVVCAGVQMDDPLGMRHVGMVSGAVQSGVRRRTRQRKPSASR